jgi:hypothetical protein
VKAERTLGEEGDDVERLGVHLGSVRGGIEAREARWKSRRKRTATRERLDLILPLSRLRTSSRFVHTLDSARLALSTNSRIDPTSPRFSLIAITSSPSMLAHALDLPSLVKHLGRVVKKHDC